jgi:PEP-CTERM motif
MEVRLPPWARAPLGNLVIGPISYGTFTINDSSAQSRAVLGPPGLLNSQNLDISSDTAGILTIYVTAQGLSFTGVQNFASTFAINDLTGSVVGVIESTYFSPTNGLYNTGQTLLDSFSFNDIGIKGPDFALGTTSGTYSVTERFVIIDTGGGAGNDNVTIDLLATPVVPEPGTLLLVGSGLALAGLLYYRRRNKRSCLLISNA